MCQLLGVSSNKPVNIAFSLKEFRYRGEKNPHGFGFAFYCEGMPKIIKKPTSLAKENMMTNKFKFQSKIIIGHVRLASCGIQIHKNTHPFEQEKWCFAHNGTVTDIKSFPFEKFEPKGETDSEYAFCYLLDRIYLKSKLNEIVDVLQDESLKIAKLGRFNFLFSDGKNLYAFGHDSLYFVKRQSPFQEVTLKDAGYHLHLNEIKEPDEKAIIIATVPFTKQEDWNRINGLLVFSNGEEIKV